jgi:hypothetical protein
MGWAFVILGLLEWNKCIKNFVLIISHPPNAVNGG